MTTRSDAGRPFVGLALCVGAFLAVVVSAVVAHELGAVEALTAMRIVVMGIGAVLVAAGNLAPKLGLFRATARHSGRALRAERFTGWTLVLTGAAVIGLWLFWPGDRTMLVSSLVALAAFVLVGSNWVWLALRSGGRVAVSDEPAERLAAIKRLTLLQILFSLFWVFAMFAADTLWGRAVVTWMVVVFSVLLGLLTWPLARLTRACGQV